jgi:hypothetical protein
LLNAGFNTKFQRPETTSPIANRVVTLVSQRIR